MTKLTLVLIVAALAAVTANQVPQKRIIGGQLVDPGSPLQSVVYWVMTTDGSCSGVAVSPSVLLTAGHCFVSTPKARVAFPTTPGVPVSSANASTYQWVQAPYATASNGGMDFAIVGFNSQVFSTYASLDGTGAFSAYETLIAAGFGYTDTNFGGIGSGLRTTRVYPASDAMCTAMTGVYTSDRTCMLQSDGLVCNGDSGGALFATTDDGALILTGLLTAIFEPMVSANAGMICATSPILVVTKMSVYYSFLKRGITYVNGALAFNGLTRPLDMAAVVMTAPPTPATPQCPC
jgi:V8-like Glu-specific endopeptidase